MRRRSFMALLGGAVGLPLPGLAQRHPNPLIGFLGVGSSGGFAAEVAAFKQGLADNGWVVGQNASIEYRWAEGHVDRLPDLAVEFVAANAAVIVTSGGAIAARAARDATAVIPIVFETGIDPVEAGLVRSFARPGGNLTGISIATGELNPKRLELLSQLVPDASAIGMLINPRNSKAWSDHIAAVMQGWLKLKGSSWLC